jgi:hypothetical protein
MAATAKTITLKGDSKNPESAEHIIEFPGGSISVCRTSANEYWAHIAVNREDQIADIVHASKKGEIKTIRIDTPEGMQLLDHKNTDHFAVLIKTE